MKIKEYIEQLQEVAEEYPDLEVVYSADDEGNSYSKIYFSPTLGCFTDDREFYAQEEFDDYNEGEEWLKLNAVCVN